MTLNASPVYPPFCRNGTARVSNGARGRVSRMTRPGNLATGLPHTGRAVRRRVEVRVVA